MYGEKINVKKYYRASALYHKNRPKSSNVKVAFMQGSNCGKTYTGKQKSYFMSEKTYHKIPLLKLVTISDYRKFGKVIKANNNNIYDSEMNNK